MNKLIDGKVISKKILDDAKARIKNENLKPKLAILLASFDPSSKIYVDLKKKRAEEISIEVEVFEAHESVELDEVLSLIDQWNKNNEVSGILVQLPLFNHLQSSTQKILSKVDLEKDVDGLNPAMQGLVSNLISKSFPTAAVEACLESLNWCFGEDLSFSNITGQKPDSLESLKSQDVLIVNNSNLIGKPLGMILSSLGATVTIGNHNTKNLFELSKKADIIVSATNQTNLFSASNIKKDSILIDVTSVRKEDKVLGDFIYDDTLIEKCKFYTPVPGGIGPITVSCLLRNVVGSEFTGLTSL